MQLQVKQKKSSANNVFRSKETRNKIPPKVFRGFETGRKVQFMFSRPRDNMKRKFYGFSNHKERNKVCLIYLGSKLRQDSYG